MPNRSRRRPAAPRELFAAALAVGLVAAGAGCGSGGGEGAARRASTTAASVTATPSSTSPTSTSAAARVSPVRHYALAGDSVAVSLLPSVRAALAGLDPRVPEPGLRILAALGFGWTADVPGTAYDGTAVPSPDAWAGWRDRLRAALADDPAEVVVVLGGIWDAIVDRELDGTPTPPGPGTWHDWYVARVRDAAAIYAGARRRVVWLLPPCTGAAETDRRLARVRDAMRRALGDTPRVQVVDLTALACPAGRPVHELTLPDGTTAPLLEDNGIHFAHDDAVPAAAPWLAERLRAALGLPTPAVD